MKRRTSHRFSRLLIIAGTAALVLPVATAVGRQNETSKQQDGSKSATASSSGSADNGKRLFMRDGCYECHGISGQGALTGPRLAPNPIPAEAIMAYIRKPTGRMPPFSSHLVSDQDVTDIYTYLKSVPGPADVKNVPSFTK
jgi:mono/diheme cytochrome c family protein